MQKEHIINKDDIVMSGKGFEKLLEVLCRADGGCSTCVRNLIYVLIDTFDLDKEVIRPILRTVAERKKYYWAKETDEWLDDLEEEEEENTTCVHLYDIAILTNPPHMKCSKCGNIQ